jgi:hypothetical protein
MNVATELESPQTKSAATGRMEALVYHGPGKQAWEETPRPAIQVATDAIVRITTSTIPPHLIETLRWLGILIRPGLRERRDLVLENLALRQQLAVFKGRNRVLRLKTGRPSISADALSNLGSLAIAPFSACEAESAVMACRTALPQLPPACYRFLSTGTSTGNYRGFCYHCRCKGVNPPLRN